MISMPINSYLEIYLMFFISLSMLSLIIIYALYIDIKEARKEIARLEIELKEITRARKRTQS